MNEILNERLDLIDEYENAYNLLRFHQNEKTLIFGFCNTKWKPKVIVAFTFKSILKASKAHATIMANYSGSNLSHVLNIVLQTHFL